MNVGLIDSVIEKLRPGPTLVPLEVQFITQAAAFAANDVLTAATEIRGALRKGKPGVFFGFTLRDSDDLTAAAMDLYLFDQEVTLGAINSAITITDSDAKRKLGKISITAANWQDMINSRQVEKWWYDFGPVGLRSANSDGSIWATLVSVDGTTPTSVTAFSGTFWFLQGK